MHTPNTTHSPPEHPCEKLTRFGAEHLSDAELLALLLGRGTGGKKLVSTAQRLLQQSGGLHRLRFHGQGSLSGMRGVGEAQANRLLAAVEIGRRVQLTQHNRAQDNRFTCSDDIFQAYRTRLSGLAQEVFLVVGLNIRHQVQCEHIVARGTVSECHVSPREIFRPLIMAACAKMAALHNHPSGDPTPSIQDIALTRRIAEVGDLVGIPLLDHIVVGISSYTSFRDLGFIGA
ncbi:MAG: DNA repair protein RadC [Proteobacteria bacterium]|jgi:DNA repair protein RadC|nr:DNA repair protein RadC [Pseudomonadota bacterium]NLN63442.1 DNA repair protein RadC [Myxococcales bacterium]